MAELTEGKRKLINKLKLMQEQTYSNVMNQAKSDTKFASMVQSMTIDRVAGKTALTKNKFNF